MTEKYFITLIHGTFAPEAAWTREDSKSKFREKLAKRLGDVEFERRGWGGRNRQVDRRKGGQVLAESLGDPDSTKKGRKHFVVCHSHGGNVALYAAADKGVEKNLSGIVCMNTPFICALPRNFRPLFVALAFVLLLALSGILDQLGGMLWFTDWEWWKKLIMFLVFAPVSFLLTLVLVFGFFSVFDMAKWLGQKRDKVLNRLNLPDTRIPILSIWTAGDEISFVFSIASGFGNLPLLFLYPPVVIVSVIVLMGGVILGWLPGLDIFHFETEIWFLNLVLWADTYLFDPFLTAGAYFFGVMVCVVVMVLLVNLLLCVLPYGLGIRDIISPLWIRFFVTPVPVQATNTEFRSIDPAASGLSHSVVYELDPVIDAIADWMRNQGGTN